MNQRSQPDSIGHPPEDRQERNAPAGGVYHAADPGEGAEHVGHNDQGEQWGENTGFGTAWVIAHLT